MCHRALTPTLSRKRATGFTNFAGYLQGRTPWRLQRSGPIPGAGFRPWRLVIAIPSAEPGDDPTEPGQTVLRMRVALAPGLAFQGGAQRDGGCNLGVACYVASRAVAAVTGIDQLDDADSGSHGERSEVEQPMRIEGLSLLDLQPVALEHAKALLDPPAQSIKPYDIGRSCFVGSRQCRHQSPVRLRAFRGAGDTTPRHRRATRPRLPGQRPLARAAQP